MALRVGYAANLTECRVAMYAAKQAVQTVGAVRRRPRQAATRRMIALEIDTRWSSDFHTSFQPETTCTTNRVRVRGVATDPPGAGDDLPFEFIRSPSRAGPHPARPRAARRLPRRSELDGRRTRAARSVSVTSPGAAGRSRLPGGGRGIGSAAWNRPDLPRGTDPLMVSTLRPRHGPLRTSGEHRHRHFGTVTRRSAD